MFGTVSESFVSAEVVQLLISLGIIVMGLITSAIIAAGHKWRVYRRITTGDIVNVEDIVFDDSKLSLVGRLLNKDRYFGTLAAAYLLTIAIIYAAETAAPIGVREVNPSEVLSSKVPVKCNGNGLRRISSTTNLATSSVETIRQSFRARKKLESVTKFDPNLDPPRTTVWSVTEGSKPGPGERWIGEFVCEEIELSNRTVAFQTPNNSATLQHELGNIAALSQIDASDRNAPSKPRQGSFLVDYEFDEQPGRSTLRHTRNGMLVTIAGEIDGLADFEAIVYYLNETVNSDDGTNVRHVRTAENVRRCKAKGDINRGAVMILYNIIRAGLISKDLPIDEVINAEEELRNLMLQMGMARYTYVESGDGKCRIGRMVLIPVWTWMGILFVPFATLIWLVHAVSHVSHSQTSKSFRVLDSYAQAAAVFLRHGRTDCVGRELDTKEVHVGAIVSKDGTHPYHLGETDAGLGVDISPEYLGARRCPGSPV